MEIFEELKELRERVFSFKRLNCTFQQLQSTAAEALAIASRVKCQKDEDEESDDSTTITTMSSEATIYLSKSDYERFEYLVEEIFMKLFNLSAEFQRISSSLSPIYNELVSIKHELCTFEKTCCFNEKDLQALQDRLHDIENTHVSDGKFMIELPKVRESRPNFELLNKMEGLNVQSDETIPSGQAILMQTLNSCYRQVNKCLIMLDGIESSLEPLYNELVAIQKQLRKTSLLPNEILEIQQALYRISAGRVNGLLYVAENTNSQNIINNVADFMDNSLQSQFNSVDGINAIPVPKGQAMINNVLEQNYDLLYEIQERFESIEAPDHKSGSYKTLLILKEKIEALEKHIYDLNLVERVSHILSDLTRIETELSNHPKSKENYSLLNHCYQKLQSILYYSDPVDPSLSHIHSQLLVNRRCLLEFRNVVCSEIPNTESLRITFSDLTPFKMKLMLITDMQTDGKFLDGEGNVPKGQSILCCLLSQCYQILDELEGVAEDEEEDDEEIGHHEENSFPVFQYPK
jgi:archaellum component FlaC